MNWFHCSLFIRNDRCGKIFHDPPCHDHWPGKIKYTGTFLLFSLLSAQITVTEDPGNGLMDGPFPKMTSDGIGDRQTTATKPVSPWENGEHIGEKKRKKLAGWTSAVSTTHTEEFARILLQLHHKVSSLVNFWIVQCRLVEKSLTLTRMFDYFFC